MPQTDRKRDITTIFGFAIRESEWLTFPSFRTGRGFIVIFRFGERATIAKSGKSVSPALNFHKLILTISGIFTSPHIGMLPCGRPDSSSGYMIYIMDAEPRYLILNLVWMETSL